MEALRLHRNSSLDTHLGRVGISIAGTLLPLLKIRGEAQAAPLGVHSRRAVHKLVDSVGVLLWRLIVDGWRLHLHRVMLDMQRGRAVGIVLVVLVAEAHLQMGVVRAVIVVWLALLGVQETGFDLLLFAARRMEVVAVVGMSARPYPSRSPH